MFKHLSIFRQILLFFLVLGILTTLFFGAKYLYKNDIKKDVVQDINTQTQINEGEAIEKAKKINADVSGLADADVDAGLQWDFRTDDSRDNITGVGVPNLPNNQTFAVGYSRNKASSTVAQHPIPSAVRESNSSRPEWNDAIWRNTVNRTPCTKQYGFDIYDNIIEIETCP